MTVTEPDDLRLHRTLWVVRDTKVQSTHYLHEAPWMSAKLARVHPYEEEPDILRRFSSYSISEKCKTGDYKCSRTGMADSKEGLVTASENLPCDSQQSLHDSNTTTALTPLSKALGEQLFLTTNLQPSRVYTTVTQQPPSRLSRKPSAKQLFLTTNPAESTRLGLHNNHPPAYFEKALGESVLQKKKKREKVYGYLPAVHLISYRTYTSRTEQLHYRLSLKSSGRKCHRIESTRLIPTSGCFQCPIHHSNSLSQGSMSGCLILRLDNPVCTVPLDITTDRRLSVRWVTSCNNGATQLSCNNGATQLLSFRPRQRQLCRHAFLCMDTEDVF
ncbi:hypothetical protein J6590_064719 [Homalodisca vitripennis]|nr:hypothetical protein J6590_064719 [Homalodisca vitripennis]